ncbi:MAG: galactose-1-phosphate uridylyltransferase [Actinobacteria bacterium]|nr:galactose-1-phosphate uridylyltransferase [Actinomycetota bacterium]
MVTDDLSGREVVIAGSRQDRPNLPVRGCPFCVGGLEAPDPYTVRTFVNRWPALPDDRAEVVLYTPNHDATFASLGVAGAGAVIDAWAERSEALGGRADVAYVLVFENRGAAVGATIGHPHGQIYAFTSVPEAPARELDHPCSLCGHDPGDRVVSAAGDWQAYVPEAAEWPYELRVAPRSHVGTLAECDRAGLGGILVDVLARLDRLFPPAPMPYMLWVHQRPSDGGEWPEAHLHVHVAPLLRATGVPRFVAAGELGSGVYFNPVAPADAAARLRDA